MAVARPGVITRGTARDLAVHGAGYVASGEGEFSRRAAQPGNATVTKEITELKAPRRRVDPIAYQLSEAARIRTNIQKHAANPEKVAALQDLLRRKLSFIQRLRAER
jgi:hypothetical protein